MSPELAPHDRSSAWMKIFAIPMLGLLGLLGVQPAYAEPDSSADTCANLPSFVGGARDVGLALQACIDETPAHGIVELAPGPYLIETPVHLRRPLTIKTRGISFADARCFGNERRCALLHLAISPSAISSAVMPFNVESDSVRLDHLVFQGTRSSDPNMSSKRCASDKERAMAGGVRINGNSIVISRSVFRDMACYTALEYGTGIDATIKENAFVENGIHNIEFRWADGLTIHNAVNFRVSDNLFRDNTDVQLIFGSCIFCTIVNNRFEHSQRVEGGSFAELMLQAWPNATSGNFTDTRVELNTIDCGPRRRCGFGIMIGSAPWYSAPAFGGRVTENRVRGAMLALNVDSLTGPMVIERNELEAVSGTYPSMCGPSHIDGVAQNISPVSRAFASVSQNTSTSFEHYCILNYDLK